MPTPAFVTLIRRLTEEAPSGAQPAASSTFAIGLIHRVAVEHDANEMGLEKEPRGGIQQDWQPVPGLESVACRVIVGPSGLSDGDPKPGVTASARVLFGSPIVLDRRNRLAQVDRDSGDLRHWYIVGDVRNAHGTDHHWVADVSATPL